MTDACWAGALEDLEQSILDLLDQRAPGVTICPSEAARAVAADAGGDLRHAELPQLLDDEARGRAFVKGEARVGVEMPAPTRQCFGKGRVHVLGHTP